jgi:purine-cytosine permease-like protein
MTAWIVSALLALLMVDIPDHYVGLIARASGADLDLSLLAALVLPAILYPVCLTVLPEPRAVFGPGGPWLVGAADVPIAPVMKGR